MRSISILKNSVLVTLLFVASSALSNTPLTEEEVEAISSATEQKLNTGILATIHNAISQLKGEKGDQGEQGESGIVDATSLISLQDVIDSMIRDFFDTKEVDHVQLSPNSATICDPNTEGAIRMSGGKLQSCDGSQFVSYELEGASEYPVSYTKFYDFQSGSRLLLKDFNGSDFNVNNPGVRFTLEITCTVINPNVTSYRKWIISKPLGYTGIGSVSKTTIANVNTTGVMYINEFTEEGGFLALTVSTSNARVNCLQSEVDRYGF